ncbi:MAG: hypothetical protein ACR2KT_12750 [Methylocella sp.]
MSAGFGFVEESCFRAKVKVLEHQDRQSPGGFRLQGLGSRCMSAQAFPIGWNPSIEQESLKLKELEHVLVEKVGHFFNELL